MDAREDNLYGSAFLPDKTVIERTTDKERDDLGIRTGVLLMPVRDASFGEVVRRHLQGDSITGQNANSIAPQLARQVGQNGSVLIKLHAE